MNTLYIVVGVPGCGKSTWCNAKIAANPNWLHISRDEVRFSMIKEEDDYFSKEKQVFNEYVRQIAEGLEYTNVIADATHLNEPSRLKLIRSIEKLRPDLEYSIFIVYFDVSREVCKARNNKRTGRARVPEEVIDKMYNSMTFPECYPNLIGVEIVRD